MCTNKTNFLKKCSECLEILEEVKDDWEKIYKIMENYSKNSPKNAKKILFGDPHFDDYEEFALNKRSSDFFIFFINYNFIFITKLYKNY